MSSNLIVLEFKCYILLRFETSDSQRTAMLAEKCEYRLLGDKDDTEFSSVWAVDILLLQYMDTWHPAVPSVWTDIQLDKELNSQRKAISAHRVRLCRRKCVSVLLPLPL